MDQKKAQHRAQDIYKHLIYKHFDVALFPFYFLL